MRALAVVGLLLALPVARADEGAAKCQVRVIQALKDSGGIDPKITLLRPYLEKAPFTAWHHFKMLDEKEATLAPRTTATFDLPNGRKAELTFVEHLMPPNDDHRMRLRLVILEGSKKMLNTTFVLDEGGVVLQAGQRYQNGLLILGVSCQTEK